MSKRGYQGGDGFNKRRNSGKPVIKMLCPYYCAGAIIGKGGETIKELMDKTECEVKVSKNDERFPTTTERVVSAQGEMNSLIECIIFCQDKIRKDQPPPNAKSESHAINSKRKEACKLVVSDTSAGRIIGKGGQRIKDMKSEYGVDINISRKDELPPRFEERYVSVEGDEGSVDNCIREIIKLVCEDESATMEWIVFYNDWNDKDGRDGRGGGFGGRDRGSRDGGRDSYAPRDSYGARDTFGGSRDSRDPYEDRRGGGGYEDRRPSSYDDRRGDRDPPRDSYVTREAPRDYGREDRGYAARESYGGAARDSYGERDRGYGAREAPRDEPRRDDYAPRVDSYASSRTESYGASRDYGRGDTRDTGRASFERRDNYRDEPRGRY